MPSNGDSAATPAPQRSVSSPSSPATAEMVDPPTMKWGGVGENEYQAPAGPEAGTALASHWYAPTGKIAATEAWPPLATGRLGGSVVGTPPEKTFTSSRSCCPGMPDSVPLNVTLPSGICPPAGTAMPGADSCWSADTVGPPPT